MQNKNKKGLGFNHSERSEILQNRCIIYRYTRKHKNKMEKLSKTTHRRKTMRCLLTLSSLAFEKG